MDQRVGRRHIEHRGLFLLFGGLIGGASVVGAEWRAGTVTTVLTRGNCAAHVVHLSRSGPAPRSRPSSRLALQVVFLAALLPAALTHGSTAGLDGSWWAALLRHHGAHVARDGRGGDALGGALATLGRNTGFCARNGLRLDHGDGGADPRLCDRGSRGCCGEKTSRPSCSGRSLDNAEFHREPVTAFLTITLYVGLIVAAATWAFALRRRCGRAVIPLLVVAIGVLGYLAYRRWGW